MHSANVAQDLTPAIRLLTVESKGLQFFGL